MVLLTLLNTRSYGDLAFEIHLSLSKFLSFLLHLCLTKFVKITFYEKLLEAYKQRLKLVIILNKLGLMARSF